MAAMLTCSDVAGPSSSGSGDLFELSDRSNETDPESLLLFPPLLALLAAILDLSVTTTSILPLGACYTSLCIRSIPNEISTNIHSNDRNYSCLFDYSLFVLLVLAFQPVSSLTP